MIIFTSQVGKMPLNLGKQFLRGKTNMIFASEKCPHATGPKYAVSMLKHKVLLLIPFNSVSIGDTENVYTYAAVYRNKSFQIRISGVYLPNST